jgi:hypothetical protein
MSKNIDDILLLTDTFISQAEKELFKTAKKVKKESDPEAGVRNRGKCVFPAEHPKVKDDEDHFPINTAAQARNALARVNQVSKAPSWFKGTVQEMVNAVVRAVKKEYPSIEVSKQAKKPGKD